MVARVTSLDTSPMIRLDDVTKLFPGTASAAVDGLTLHIAEGEIVVLVGPSGCGKTTTLKMINRLVEPTSGSIIVDGDAILDLPAHELRRRIGYVIQQIGLFPHRTIRENIATVPRLLGWNKASIDERVDELADLVDIDRDMLSRYPAELSGGQRQRIGVARALAADPPVLLMDEPFGAVDPIVRARLQQELLSLQERLRKTIVLVTHDIDEAIALGDRVAILNVGGYLEQYAPPGEILRDPANAFVADFLGTDRGIKRLSLIPISSVGLIDGAMIDEARSTSEAIELASRLDSDWVGVLRDGKVRGWAWLDAVKAADSLASLDVAPFLSTLSIDDNLREALDTVVSSHTSVAIVLDDDRYVGMLTMDQISREIVQ